MKQDAAGYTYVTGSRLIEGVCCATAGYPKVLTSVFAARFDPSGAPVYMIELGGKGSDSGLGIAADAQGNAFVVGSTTSPDFPIKNAVQPRPAENNGTIHKTGFVTKLSPTGDIIFSTYFGGAGSVFYGSEVTAVAVDVAGNAYVTGNTDSRSLTVTPGAFQQVGIGGSFQVAAFVAKLDPRGTVAYSTYLGGLRLRCGLSNLVCTGSIKLDSGTAIAVTAAGEVYILGETNASDFPVTPGAYQPTCVCPRFPLTVPFLAKLNSTGSGLVFATLFSGPIRNEVNPLVDAAPPVALALATDAAGNALIAGSASNAGFPTTAGVLQPSNKGGWDGFLTKFSATGALVFSTFLGGEGTDSITAIAVDPSGAIRVAGKTNSSMFPDSTAIFPEGVNFAAELDAPASKLTNSIRLPAGVSDSGMTSDNVVAGSPGLVTRINFGGPQQTALLGMGNAALHGLGAASASSVISLYGVAIGGPGVRVTFEDGLKTNVLPLLYVSPTQINTILPLNVFRGVITVTINGTTVSRFDVALQEVSPQVFRRIDGTALAVNQDGTLNSAANPAVVGDVVSVWGTGVPVFRDPPSIDPATIADRACALYYLLSVSAGELTYSGCAPGAPEAVFQVNIRLRSIQRQFVVSVNGVDSEPFLLHVKSQ